MTDRQQPFSTGTEGTSHRGDGDEATRDTDAEGRNRRDDATGLKRREVLKASGLAAVADIEALTGTDPEPEIGPDDRPYERFLDRLPAPAQVPDGHYDATIARRLDEDVLAVPDALADADAHASLVTSRASLTMALGANDASAAADALLARGYQRTDDLAERPMYLRRGRYSQRVAVLDDDVVAIARGPEIEPAVSLAGAVSTPSAAAVEQRLPRVATVLDGLGSGAVVSVTSSTEGPDTTRGTPQPVVTGECLTLRAPEARLRRAAVYASRTARDAALRTTRDTPRPAHTRDSLGDSGVVRELAIPEPDLPVSE